MPGLQILEREDGVIEVIGDVDADSAEPFSDALTSRRDGDVRLRLAKCSFMDSSGLRALLLARQSCDQRNAGFVLLDPSSVVMRLFEVAGLVDHFEIHGRASTEPGRR